MVTTTELKFAGKGARIGSVFVMEPATAIEFVKECAKLDINILGVEGFMRFERGIQPQQEHSCDYGSELADSHHRAIEFLSARRDSGLWFEVVTDEIQV